MRTIKYRNTTIRIADKSFSVDGYTGFLYVNEKITDADVTDFVEAIYKMAKQDIQNDLKRILGVK